MISFMLLLLCATMSSRCSDRIVMVRDMFENGHLVSFKDGDTYVDIGLKCKKEFGFVSDDQIRLISAGKIIYSDESYEQMIEKRIIGSYWQEKIYSNEEKKAIDNSKYNATVVIENNIRLVRLNQKANLSLPNNSVSSISESQGGSKLNNSSLNVVDNNVDQSATMSSRYCEQKKIQPKIKDSNGCIYLIDLTEGETYADLAKKIKEKAKVPDDVQISLVYWGKLLYSDSEEETQKYCGETKEVHDKREYDLKYLIEENPMHLVKIVNINKFNQQSNSSRLANSSGNVEKNNNSWHAVLRNTFSNKINVLFFGGAFMITFGLGFFLGHCYYLRPSILNSNSSTTTISH